MKRILFATSIITILLFIACANSASKTNLQKTDDNKQQNKNTLQFTPEEIAYNDSIKDLPMDYILLFEKKIIQLDDSKYVSNSSHEDELDGPTQEEAYLLAYDYFCGTIIHNNLSKYYTPYKDMVPKFRYKIISIKILNKDRKDIVPLIDFSDRRQKENEIWKDHIKNRKTHDPAAININYDEFVQPVINKGEPMLWVDDED